MLLQKFQFKLQMMVKNGKQQLIGVKQQKAGLLINGKVFFGFGDIGIGK